MLKLLIVKPEQKCGHLPIRMSVGTPMLDSQDGKRLAEIPLERYAMKCLRIIRCGIDQRIVERGQRVFEASTKPLAGILKRLRYIGFQLASYRRKRCSILSPYAEPIAGITAWI